MLLDYTLCEHNVTPDTMDASLAIILLCKHGLTQREIAEAVRCSPQCIGRWIDGKEIQKKRHRDNLYCLAFGNLPTSMKMQLARESSDSD